MCVMYTSVDMMCVCHCIRLRFFYRCVRTHATHIVREKHRCAFHSMCIACDRMSFMCICVRVRPSVRLYALTCTYIFRSATTHVKSNVLYVPSISLDQHSRRVYMALYIAVIYLVFFFSLRF